MDNLTKLNILQDYITRTANDLKIIKASIITGDEAALHALYRYFLYLRDYTGRDESTRYKRGIALEVCDIIGTYLIEHSKKEVETWTEADS